MITRASSADVSLWSDLNILKREVYQLTVYKSRHYVNRKHTCLLALYTNQSESSFTFSLFNQPIRRESQNLAFYMRPGKELYQALLHSRHYLSNPGEWRKGPDSVRLCGQRNSYVYKRFLLQTCSLIGQRQKLKNMFTPIVMVRFHGMNAYFSTM